MIVSAACNNDTNVAYLLVMSLFRQDGLTPLHYAARTEGVSAAVLVRLVDDAKTVLTMTDKVSM